MIDESIESVALARGEQCLKKYIEICTKLNEEIDIDDPDRLALLGLIILAHWYTGREFLEEEEVIKYQKFLRDVMAYTYKHKKAFETLN